MYPETDDEVTSGRSSYKTQCHGNRNLWNLVHDLLDSKKILHLSKSSGARIREGAIPINGGNDILPAVNATSALMLVERNRPNRWSLGATFL